MQEKIRIILFLMFTFLLYNCALALEQEVESQIRTVTVYPDSALVSRLATLKLELGEHKIIFANIIPDIDENSLRAAASGSAEFKILGAQVKKEFLREAPDERMKRLQEEIQKLEDDKKRLTDTKEIILQERQFLDSIRLFSKDQIPKDLVTKMPTVKDLDDTLKFLDLKLRDNYTQIIDAELNIREIEKKIEVLKEESRQVSNTARKLKRLIVVELLVSKPGNLALSVSYLLRGAAWQPIYDARANFEKSEVEFDFLALVRQKTGEDWQDVEMSLSTAKPTQGGNLPYISSWFLRPAPIFKEGRLDKLGYQRQAMKSGVALEAAADKAEIEYSRTKEKGTAVVYQLTRKVTVKSDGTEYKLPVSGQVLPAKFEYSSYPRAVLNAYLGSRVKNSPSLQLLSGRVNVFLDGDYVGTSNIESISPQEEFDLYLGVDENVKVKREQVEKKVDDTLFAGIPSPTKRLSIKYKVTVENYKTKKAKIKLFEAMPISENDKINVKISNVSLEPKVKDWEDRKGVWLWELELSPKAKEEIFYTLTIEYPRDLQIEGL